MITKFDAITSTRRGAPCGPLGGFCRMQKDVKTLVEIKSQPEVWQRCLKNLGAANLRRLAEGHSPSDLEWVFVGCGTSFYLAQAAACSFSSLLKVAARAVPASEVLFNRDGVFPEGVASY